MYDHASIEKFRGIRHLALSNLGRVNLFVGPNNAGKTSLLEALWLLQAPGNPTATLVLSMYRGFNAQIQAPNLTWPTFFYDSNLTQVIRIRGARSDGSSEMLTIRHANEWPDQSDLGSNGMHGAVSSSVVNPSVVTPETLYFEYSENGQDPVQASFSIGLGRVGANPRAEFMALRSYFLPARHRLTPEELASRFTTVQDREGQSGLVASLAVLQPGLENVSIGYRTTDGGSPQVQLRAHISGMTHPMPLQVLGEGVGRLAEILLSISSLSQSVIFVDEVESGLYYRNMEAAWRAIDVASQEADVQIFATTHSAECVLAAVRATNGTSAADFRLIRLDPGPLGIEPVIYDHENASAVFAFNLEFR